MADGAEGTNLFPHQIEGVKYLFPVRADTRNKHKHAKRLT